MDEVGRSLPFGEKARQLPSSRSNLPYEEGARFGKVLALGREVLGFWSAGVLVAEQVEVAYKARGRMRKALFPYEEGAPEEGAPTRDGSGCVRVEARRLYGQNGSNYQMQSLKLAKQFV